MLTSNASQIPQSTYLKILIHKSWILFLVPAYTAVKIWQMARRINIDSIIEYWIYGVSLQSVVATELENQTYSMYILSWETLSLRKYSLHHITSRHITSHHITSHHITSHHITSHHITSHYNDYITLHYITLHYITLHYITLHYITLHYITLHYIT